MNLSLDLWAVKDHAQKVMRDHGITYDHAVPQSIADCWWFFNCKNVPDPIPSFLSPIKRKPTDLIGFGLSKETAERLESMEKQP